MSQAKRRSDSSREHPLPNNQNLNSGENAARIGIPEVPPGHQHHQASPIHRTTDIRVGSVVCALVDAEIDGGYLLTVRGDTAHTTLRGFVYKPGRYVSDSTENDVAADVPITGRNGIPDVPVSSTSITSNGNRPEMPTVETEGRENQPSQKDAASG